MVGDVMLDSSVLHGFTRGRMEQDWHMDGVVFLGIPEQKRLGYRIHDLLPFRNYARKNLGYLYAIQVHTH